MESFLGKKDETSKKDPTPAPVSNIPVKTNYFDQQILAGLKKIPTTGYPGTLIVTGDAQPVFTAPNSGDTFLAACEYGSGRIFVSAHDCYISWLQEKNDDTETVKSFIKRVKQWLTVNSIHGQDNGYSADNSKIGDFETIIESLIPLENYRIITWSASFEPSPIVINKLLAYIENGGSLFCGVTVWGHLQCFERKRVEDILMYQFLRDFTGILLTSECLWLGKDEMPVDANRAKHSHFDLALERVISNPLKIQKYSNTICNGLDVLKNEEIISVEKILEIKGCLQVQYGLNIIPGQNNKPIKDVDEQNVVRLMGKCLCYAECEKADGIEDFPGDFSTQPDLLDNVEIEFECLFDAYETFSTGYYLPAGVSLLINGCAIVNSKWPDWSVQIGAHTDDLSNCSEYHRWPSVTVNRKLAGQQMCVCSPFGGLVYFCCKLKGAQLRVMLNNVVEAPYIDLKKTVTVNDWDRRHVEGFGLWADLAGKHIIFTVPSKCIRDLADPTRILEFWDKVVQTHHQCRGSDANKFKRERVVCDKQASVGYMHSGYPIVTHLDVCECNSDDFILNYKRMSKHGSWGLFHEIGHNMQQREWTFDGSVEVTVNIFSMHAYEFVVGQKVLKQKWPREARHEFAKYFKNPTFDNWRKNPRMGLMTFAQLIKHFGWDAMRKFMGDYEHDIEQKTSLPETEQDKIDQWVIRYSKIVNKNIRPQFEMFGLPVTASKVDEQLYGLEFWLVEEEKDPNVFFESS